MNNRISQLRRISLNAKKALTISFAFALTWISSPVIMLLADEAAGHGMIDGEMGHHAIGGDAVIAGIDLINSSGFHGMQEQIAAAQSMEDISSSSLEELKMPWQL